jgi:two-component system NtrC family response regulator
MDQIAAMTADLSDKTPETRPVLLLVDDDEDIREQLRWALEKHYQIVEAKDRRTAIVAVRRRSPRLVLLDLGLPPSVDSSAEGLATLKEIMQQEPGTKVIILTGNSDRPAALEAVQRGAYDYLAKPPDLDALRVILSRALHMAALEEECRRTHGAGGESAFCGIIGKSESMRRLYDAIRRVAATNVSVLITGESGTGKELVARAIHSLSAQSDQPFVPIHCAAIPETLLESELFGHERGAFTGAERQQKGRLEIAQGGTVFLDEVGEIPASIQVKLLRFLQDQRLERLGGREQIQVNTRILAATNRELRAAITEGRFREDLFYRLSVVEIAVPPLREREDDVATLAQAFVDRYREELNPKVAGITEDAFRAIRMYPWPGNVRELENRIKRAVVMTRSSMLQDTDVELPRTTESSPTIASGTLREVRDQVERTVVHRALIDNNWNITHTAEALDISRQTLHDMMKKYGFDRPR